MMALMVLPSLSNHIADLLRVDAGSDTIFGAYLPTSFLGSAIAGLHAVIHDDRVCASRHLAIAPSTIGRVRPWILISIWIAVIPSVGTGYLEVHIAEEILKTLDIGQQNDNRRRYHRLPDHRRYLLPCFLIGTPAAIRDMQDAQVDAMRGGTVGLEGLGYGTDCVRELLLGRQYRNQGTLCQCSMANLTTSRSAAGFGLSYGVAREIIVMHVTLGYFMSHPGRPGAVPRTAEPGCRRCRSESVHG